MAGGLERDGSDDRRASRLQAVDDDIGAGLQGLADGRRQVRRGVHLRAVLPDEAVPLALGIEQEAFDDTLGLRQLRGVDPMHGFTSLFAPPWRPRRGATPLT